MNPLLTFYNNRPEHDAVKAFMIQFLAELAAEKAFKNEPTSGIHEAKVVIDEMFAKLEELFGEKKKPVRRNIR
jgi:hypothetical protein